MRLVIDFDSDQSEETCGHFARVLLIHARSAARNMRVGNNVTLVGCKEVKRREGNGQASPPVPDPR
jgi:hypothetical protein